jgi:hypothetical protein
MRAGNMQLGQIKHLIYVEFGLSISKLVACYYRICTVNFVRPEAGAAHFVAV